jgi:UDP:flavonoid glycosyltransferase YjiC (YdhE family)
MSRILLLVNGLGLGNSTRCYAVIQRLLAAGAEVEVMTSDNGLWFFADKPEVGRVTEIPSLRYGQKEGRINITATLSQVATMLDTIRRAEAVVTNTIARFRPAAVVTDSIYSLQPVRRAGLPLAAINNADMVVRRMLGGGWPAAVLPQFLAVELSDYLLHRLLPDLVISPRLDPAETTEAGPFRRVGPIVRAACRPEPARSGRPERVVVMLSGSVFGSPVALGCRRPGLTIDVVGRPAPSGGMIPEGVFYHGKVRDSLTLMRDADLVVVNGGFSAVSEALFLRKPMVVIPVPRHAEQWANGESIRRLGLGIVATEEGLEEAIDAALRRIGEFRAACKALPVLANGAERAAELILDLAARRWQ